MYRLVKFGSTPIEYYNQVDAIGSGATPSAYQLLPEGGSLDLFGSQQKHAGNVERVKTMRLSAPTEAGLESLYFALLSLRGKRDKLYRATVSGDIHWQYARLVEINAQRTYEIAKYKLIQDVDLCFVTQEAFWRGDFGGIWTLDAGEYLDTGLAFDSGESYALTSSPTALTIAIGTDAGRAPIRALKIYISAGASAMSNITIARAGGESITFSGTINANKQLLIDTGAMQVLNDGADAYSSLTLSPTADLAAWFSLLPSNNAITVTFTGGGAGKQIAFQYYEAWY